MRGAGVVLIALLCLPAAAPGEDEARPLDARALSGTWHVEGQPRLRYLGALDGRLWLVGVWDEALGAIELHEAPAPAGRPTTAAQGWCLVGAGLDARGPRLSLELRAGADGALEALLRLDGRERSRERWWRAGRPRLEVLRSAWIEGRGLTVELAVGGRPQATTLRVRCAADDPRYAHLDGVVHEERLLSGAPVPVGAWALTWDGRDRSAARSAVLPGRYRVELTPVEDGLGTPAEEGAPPADPARGVASAAAKPPSPNAAAEVQVGPPPPPLAIRGAVQAIAPVTGLGGPTPASRSAPARTAEGY